MLLDTYNAQKNANIIYLGLHVGRAELANAASLSHARAAELSGLIYTVCIAS